MDVTHDHFPFLSMALKDKEGATIATVSYAHLRELRNYAQSFRSMGNGSPYRTRLRRIVSSSSQPVTGVSDLVIAAFIGALIVGL